MKNKNEGKHTPGPWEIAPEPGGNRIVKWNTERTYRFVAYTGMDYDTGNRPYQIDAHEDMANARLIAAAPELLDIVKRMNWAFYVDGTPKALRAVMSESKALISKTEGRE